MYVQCVHYLQSNADNGTQTDRLTNSRLLCNFYAVVVVVAVFIAIIVVIVTFVAVTAVFCNLFVCHSHQRCNTNTCIQSFM